MIVIFWILFSLIVGMIGSSRTIGFLGSFLLSLFLSPVVGLIIALVSKDNQTDAVEKGALKNQQMQMNDMHKLTKGEAEKKFAELEAARTILTNDEYNNIRQRIASRIVS